ncbi:putative odorant receptor 69a [Drosophila biarmipes]|uniref:putative odorant receptor 69a n=1 Tax=Drosophila biarmipes TaxID=125945 RepID=UPI0021CC7A51|nr:putative odorant receptor 69a [Drosophila biarmipes]
MQLHDYMRYIDLGCWMACIPRYEWSGRRTEGKPYTWERKALLVVGIIFEIYQIFGVIIYWYRNGRKAEDTATFVTEGSEMCGSLMLTSVGFANVYALIKNRSQIEGMFKELQEIYPQPRDRHYRCQHYYDVAMLIMKGEFVFYMIFYVYYNSAPLMLLLWEHLQEDQSLSFKTQTNTWFPWKVQGSALGFGVAILTIAIASFVGVGFSIATQNIVCIFSFQLKLHYYGMASQLLSLDARQPRAHEQLKNLIAYHSRILRIGDEFNQILNFIFGSSLVGSTIAICMTSVAVLLLDLASAFKYMSGLIAFVLYHFVICYMGTAVTAAWLGIVTYFYLFGRKEKDAVRFVTGLSEMCGSLMLICVAFINVWGLTRNRPQIQSVFAEFQVLYPKPKDGHYRTQHYLDVALFTMKCQYLLYIVFFLYYNGAPLLLLLWEYLMDRENMKYRTQTNTWFPWKVNGSALGFGLAIFVQGLASVVGVAFSLKSLNIVCIFTFQLKLHCDALASQLLRLDSRLPGSYQKLKVLVIYHGRILDIGDQVNQIMNYYFLGSLIFSTIAICMTSVAILLLDLASAFKYVSGLVAFVLYHFVICYMGTAITAAEL